MRRRGQDPLQGPHHSRDRARRLARTVCPWRCGQARGDCRADGVYLKVMNLRAVPSVCGMHPSPGGPEPAIRVPR
jgi:hypothetical protein